MSTSKNDLKCLIERLEAYIPYVLATLNPYGDIHLNREGVNISIDRGRAISSTNQLNAILSQAKQYKERLFGEQALADSALDDALSTTMYGSSNTE